MKWFGRRSKSEEIIEEVEALASSNGADGDEPVVAQPDPAVTARPVMPQPVAQSAGISHGGLQGGNGPLFGAARDQLNHVMRENMLLREENARLKEQVRQLQMMLANMQAAANLAATGMCAPAVPSAYAQTQAMPHAQPMVQQPQPMAQTMPQAQPQPHIQPQAAASQGSSDDLRAMLAELKNEIAQVKQMASSDPYLARAGAAQPMAAMAPQFGMASAGAGNGGEDVRSLLAELKSDIEALRAEQRSAAKRNGSEDLRDMLARLKEDIRSLKESSRDSVREDDAPTLSPGNRDDEGEDDAGSKDNVVHRLISDIEQGLGVQKAKEEAISGKALQDDPSKGEDEASAKARDELADQLEQMLAKLHEELRHTTQAADESKESKPSGERDEEVLRRASGA